MKLHLDDAEDEEGKESPPLNFTSMTKKKSTFADMKKAKEEADQLLKGKAPNNAKSNLLFDEKKISIFRLYGHLNRPVEYFFMILALIGSLGSGISMPSMPLQAYISSEIINSFLLIRIFYAIVPVYIQNQNIYRFGKFNKLK